MLCNTDAIFDKFRKYLEPKSNFQIARFQLQGFRQTKDESVDSFMARCKLQAQKCRFSEAEMEERLIEQLIIGTREQKVQEILLGKDEKLKLDKAMDIAQTREATVNDMKSLELQDASAGTDEANRCYQTRFQPTLWKVWTQPWEKMPSIWYKMPEM